MTKPLSRRLRRAVVAGGLGLLALAAALAALVVLPALAQQTLEFRPVGGDSVRSVTVGPGVVKMVTKSGKTVTITGDQGGPPAPPEPPEPPAPPDGRTRMHDVVRFGSDIHIDADEVVEGNVVAVGGDVEVDGTVHGDVVSIGGDLKLGSSARVDGDAVTVGGKIDRAEGAVVGGEFVTTGRFPGRRLALPFVGLIGQTVEAVTTLFCTLVLMAIAWAFCAWLPEQTRQALEVMTRRTAPSLGWGLLAWLLLLPSILALAVVVVILCITIIGIPVALLVIVGYGFGVLVLALWGYTVGSAVLGGRLVEKVRRRPATGLTEAAVWGIGLIGVADALANLIQGFGLLGIAGHLLEAVTTFASLVVVTLGMGALLLHMVTGGGLRRWWGQVRGRGAAAPVGQPVPAAAPAGPADAAPIA